MQESLRLLNPPILSPFSWQRHIFLWSRAGDDEQNLFVYPLSHTSTMAVLHPRFSSLY